MMKTIHEENFSQEFDSQVFIRIGQALCNYNKKDEVIFLNTNKTIEHDKSDSILKLDEDIKSFENEKLNILNEIEILSTSNKKISDKIKFNERLLDKLKNKFFILHIYEKDNIKYMIQKDTLIYNETFEKIANLYEEIIKIDDKIKKTKTFYI